MSLINTPSLPEDILHDLAQSNPPMQRRGNPTGVSRPIDGMMSNPGIAQSQSRFPNQESNMQQVMSPSASQRVVGNKTQIASNPQENLGMGYQTQQNNSQRTNQQSPAGRERPTLNYRKGQFRDTRLDNFRTPPSGTRRMGGTRRPPTSSGGRY
jgi:hypothetical protein